MPATAPMPAEVRIIPRLGRQRRGRTALVILGAVAVLVLSIPGLGIGLGGQAPAPRHHAAARPVPPPPVHVTVGQRAYSCTVVPAPRPARRARP
jgi:hypothetical protein